MNLYEKVREFHDKFEIGTVGPNLPKEISDYRLLFLKEELDELAVGYLNGNLEEILDALVDLVYVALGTCYLHGFDFNEAFERVHRANLNKVRVTDSSESKRGSSLDLRKPVGWQAPYLGDLVN